MVKRRAVDFALPSYSLQLWSGSRRDPGGWGPGHMPGPVGPAPEESGRPGSQFLIA
jgi:hypothetical protein